jgi:hypothetical protein
MYAKRTTFAATAAAMPAKVELPSTWVSIDALDIWIERHFETDL